MVKKKYTTYIWSLITVIISVAIIFAGTLLPGSLISNSKHYRNYSESFEIKLPKISERVVDFDGPEYYFGELEGDYYFEKLNINSTYSEMISNFTENVSLVLGDVFEIYITNDYSIEQLEMKCTVWGVFDRETKQRIDHIVSINTILFGNNHNLWNIFAYGKANEITHISRSLYLSSGREITRIENGEVMPVYTKYMDELFYQVIPALFALTEGDSLDVQVLSIEGNSLYGLYISKTDMEFEISISEELNAIMSITRVK